MINQYCNAKLKEKTLTENLKPNISRARYDNRLRSNCNILTNKREITSDATRGYGPYHIRGIWSIKECTRHSSRCSFSPCLLITIHPIDSSW